MQPINGKAVTIASSFYETLVKTNSTETIVALSADATNVNTGLVGGAIRLTELAVGRPLQWVICMLHLVEIILRHLIERIDGPNCGPDTWLGEVGQDICKLSKNHQEMLKPFVKFQRINGLVPSVIHESLELNNDQRYLHKVIRV